jgi:hypothetical protein
MVDAPAKPEATPPHELLLAAAALLAPKAEPRTMPAWATRWHHPASFGLCSSATPGKPVSEMTKAEKVQLFMASIGRAYPRMW